MNLSSEVISLPVKEKDIINVIYLRIRRVQFFSFVCFENVQMKVIKVMTSDHVCKLHIQFCYVMDY